MQENKKTTTTLKSVSITEIENAIAKSIKDMLGCKDVVCDIELLQSVKPDNTDTFGSWAGDLIIENFSINLSLKTKTEKDFSNENF